MNGLLRRTDERVNIYNYIEETGILLGFCHAHLGEDVCGDFAPVLG